MFDDTITELQQLRLLYILDDMLELFDKEDGDFPSEEKFIEMFKDKIDPFDTAFILNKLKDLQNSDEEEKDEEKDLKSDYYFHNGIEAWDIINNIQKYHNDGIDNVEAGLLFNVFKYLLRYPYKGDSEGDLKKSIKYIERIIDHIKL